MPSIKFNKQLSVNGFLNMWLKRYNYRIESDSLSASHSRAWYVSIITDDLRAFARDLDRYRRFLLENPLVV